MSGEIRERVLKFIREYGLIREGDEIVAAFSGGADSVCLLLLLRSLRREIPFSLCAVHVDHGIRGEEAQRDAAFAEQFCREKGIPFELYRVDAPERAARKKESLEEAARLLRYECLEETCRRCGAGKIATAHHADDNAETVLLHLLRGSGVQGLGGIRPARDNVIRPLLCVTRGEIETYLRENGETWCMDSTNEDVSYARNRIRSRVLPEMKAVNERAAEHLCRTAEMMQDIGAYLDAQTAQAAAGGVRFLDAAGEESGSWEGKEGRPRAIFIRKDVFAAMHPVLQRQLLYELLATAAGSRKDLTLTHVGMAAELFAGRVARSADLPYGLRAEAGYRDVVIRQRDAAPDQKQAYCFVLPADGALNLPYGGVIQAKVLDQDAEMKEIPAKLYTKWFDYDKIIHTVSVRTRRSGDTLAVTADGARKSLKDYLIDEKVPRADRDMLWLLADGSEIIWVVGYRISEAYRVTDETRRILAVTFCPEAPKAETDRIIHAKENDQ